MNRALDVLLREARRLEASGPWPFVTRLTLDHERFGRFTLASRAHRKGIFTISAPPAWQPRLFRCLWMPDKLNWWIGIIFAIGSFLFGLGSVLALWTQLANALRMDATAVNAVFFAGSIPFSSAAYLQLYQAANAPDFAKPGGTGPRGRRLIGWRPHEIGWLACALQFAGTLLFNVNTFDAILPGLNWLRQDFLVWIPDLAGSVLFLVSGYLFFVEAGHSYWSWRPSSLTWTLNFSNLLGCVAFMLSALFAFVPRSSAGFPVEALAFTLLGAAGFFVGSVLMLPETASEQDNLIPNG
ncbi:MAG: hypothetical protein D4R65_03540 [Verrucomicrobiaceae bacterium]|nr:MAG: hypothetical protein D4R65_03540 [Verrucomicrobiaceae bacterium]